MAEWTADQQKAIRSDGRNLLVSAAAGSGKTAVLVERIIEKITDPDRPLDVDRILVVTYTNAAAAQMRERIGEAIEKRLDKDPENVHLRRQSMLIHHAKITTIDSFCLSVVRDYFNRLDLSPDFRIGDQGELKLLRADVMKELMEDSYAQAGESFYRLVEGYASGKADGGIPELIERLYDFSLSYPFPEKQRELWDRELESGEGAPDDALWVRELMKEVALLTGEMERMCREAKEESADDNELSFYEPMFESDLLQIGRIRQAGSFRELYEAFKQLSFVRKPVKRKFAGNPERKEYLSSLRDKIKDQLNALKKLILTDNMESLAAKTAANRDSLRELLRLSGEFDRRFSAAKREKNLVDFSDVEHMALSVLTDENEKPTQVAKEYAARFEEVMTDEYQDSNRVQELLLRSVSRADNRFMVGDVKQSIYSFRLARPEIFVEKYLSYTLEDSPNQKINLSRNFRSRKEILDQINLLFSQLMTPALGQIDYDETAALYPGADYPVTGDSRLGELLLVDSREDVSEEMSEEAYALHEKELEARAVAERIRNLTDHNTGMKVFDGGKIRPAEYGDIVILLRTMNGWSDVFVRVLSDNGIPAIADTQSGYFDAPEVKLVLNYLRVIDNPCQDIPLAAVLHSVIGGVTSEEMAKIMAEYQSDPERTGAPRFYRAYRYYLSRGTDEKLRKKLNTVESQICELRFLAAHLSVRELLRKIFETTGYDRLAEAMPGGKTRRGNLMQLEQKAEDFARTSYRGLFNFIRYIEHLQKYEVDFGEACGTEQGGAVRVMSIHRSKGLEFPIVIVSGLAKPFNQKDSNGRVLLHPDLGIAADCVDLETRVRTKTLQQKVFARKMRLDSLGEELRILYVALTRAKEKLILTACDKNPEARWNKYSAITEEQGKALAYLWLSSAGCYLDWVMMALTRPQTLWKVERVSLNRLLTAQIETEKENRKYFELFSSWDAGQNFCPGIREEISRRINYRYPYEDELEMHTKLSVSELKTAGQAKDSGCLYRLKAGCDDGAEEPVKERESAAKLSDRTDLLQGARRGTVLHRIMEKIDFTDTQNEQSIRRQIENLCRCGLVDAKEAGAVSHRPVYCFFQGNLAKRMTNAAENGKLHRESRFVIGVPAGEIGGIYQGDEMILVQGMIDAWFEEPDGLVIVDYKSDRVDEKNGSKVLKDRYGMQLDYYRRALEQGTGKRVKECRIYSFSLGRDIVVR